MKKAFQTFSPWKKVNNNLIYSNIFKGSKKQVSKIFYTMWSALII